MDLLKQRGHEQMIFSMHDPKNEESPYSKYFAEHFDVNEAKSLGQKLKLVPKVIYNKDAAKKLDTLLKTERPDVAHVHNFYNYLTPSILDVLEKHKIPSIHKLSNYKIICPNYQLYTEGAPCTRCKGGKFYNAVIHTCMKDSKAASLLAAIDSYYHYFRNSYDKIDYYIASSDFSKELFASFGIPDEKLYLLRNIHTTHGYGYVEKKDPYFLFAGRLDKDKGVMNFLEAISKLRNHEVFSQYGVKIMGKGADKERLEEYVRDHDLENIVEFVGFHKNGTESWKELMSKASLFVHPAVFYDQSPNSVSEATGFGVPVIASDRGGSKELIEHGRSGFVYSADDIDELVGCLKNFFHLSTAEKQTFAKNAYEYFLELNNVEHYYSRLMNLYELAITKHNSK
jgi:glycosyltransferase involved in cell wall biosynthesis